MGDEVVVTIERSPRSDEAQEQQLKQPKMNGQQQHIPSSSSSSSTMHLPRVRARPAGSSYAFSDDAGDKLPPLGESLHEDDDGDDDDDDETRRRRSNNKSFDFGVAKPVQDDDNNNNNNNEGVDEPLGRPSSPLNRSNRAYYRLPQDAQQQQQQQPSPSSSMRNSKLEQNKPFQAFRIQGTATKAAASFASKRKATGGGSTSTSSTPRVALRNVVVEPESTSSEDDDDHKHSSSTAAAASNLSKRSSSKSETASLSSRPDGVVLKAPTNFNRLKSKSRLADPPPPPVILASSEATPPPSTPAAASTPRAPQAEEDEDPLQEEGDLPEKYLSRRWNLCTAFQVLALLLLIGLLACSIALRQLKRRSIWGLELWKWSVMALVVVSGRLLSGWIIHIVVFFIERNFMWRKRVLYFVYGLRNGVQTVLWLTLAFIAWLLLFDPKVERSTKNHKALIYVTKVLLCFLIAAFVWLAKLLFVKVLASSYHVSTYFDRIQESLFNQYILERLSGPPLDDEPMPETPAAAAGGGTTTGGAKISTNSDKKKKDEIISIAKLQQMNRANVSAWNMKRLVTLVKQTGISTLSQTIDSSVEEEGESEIQTEQQARKAAKLIFKNVVQPGKKYIVLDDLLRFLSESEATKALALFEGATEFGKITKKGLVNWVTNVYRERRSLALSLNDTKTAVNKLHQIINAVIIILIIVIWLLVLGLATSHLLVVVSSQLLLIVFVFGNTCKTVFEAIIFIFVMHPFDVGDRCVIDGVQMVVEEMNILTTVFLRYDNEKIYYPNSVLAIKPISNFYRSPDMGDAIDFTVHFNTPIEKIAALKSKVARYIETHTHHWHAKHTIVVKEIEDMNRMKMALWLQHTMNHQNAGERWIRRSELLVSLKSYFQELGIEYHLLPQEVNITSMKTVPPSSLTLV